MNVSIFGLGYVGAVTAGCLTEQGHKVIGADVVQKKVDAFKAGKSPIVEPGLDDMLSQAREKGLLDATTSADEAVNQSEVSIICVGTPSMANGSLNLAYVRAVTSQIAEAIQAKGEPHTILFRSTMLPGSTRSMVTEFLQALIDQGLVTVLYCPEFLREGTAIEDFRDPSLCVLGTVDSQPSGNHAEELLGNQPDVLNWEGAELIKYGCNYFHAVKVAFANEIGRVGKSVGVDSTKVMQTLCKDTRLNISSYYMRPGNPFGGSCLPKDVSALSAMARQEGIHLPILEGVMPSNQAHLDALLRQIQETGAKKVAILGLAFKNDTDDLRGSPMVSVAEFLLGRGYELRIYDPHLNLAEVMGSNERVISTTMPHLSELLTETGVDAVQDAELVIAAQKCMSLEELAGCVNSSQSVIDVNGWRELSDLAWNYDGSCW